MGWIMTVTGGTPVTFTPSWNKLQYLLPGKEEKDCFNQIQNKNDEEYYYFRCPGIRQGTYSDEIVAKYGMGTFLPVTCCAEKSRTVRS